MASPPWAGPSIEKFVSSVHDRWVSCTALAFDPAMSPLGDLGFETCPIRGLDKHDGVIPVKNSVERCSRVGCPIWKRWLFALNRAEATSAHSIARFGQPHALGACGRKIPSVRQVGAVATVTTALQPLTHTTRRADTSGHPELIRPGSGGEQSRDPGRFTDIYCVTDTRVTPSCPGSTHGLLV